MAGKWITHPPTRCPNGHQLRLARCWSVTRYALVTVAGTPPGHAAPAIRPCTGRRSTPTALCSTGQRHGLVSVRWGKAARGSPPKRRTVLTVPEMDWIVEVLDHYLAEVRPTLVPKTHPALWVTERASRLSPRAVNDAFVTARDKAGLDESLDLHCLRHSYVTHLIEFDYPGALFRSRPVTVTRRQPRSIPASRMTIGINCSCAR